MTSPRVDTVTIPVVASDSATGSVSASVGYLPALGPSQAFYVDGPAFASGLPDLPMEKHSANYRSGDSSISQAFARAVAKAKPFLYVFDVDTVTLPPDYAQGDSAMFQIGGGSKCLGIAGNGPTSTLIQPTPNGSPTRAQATSGTSPWRAVKHTDSLSLEQPHALYYVGNFAIADTAWQGVASASTPGGIDRHLVSFYHPDADEIHVGDIVAQGGHSSGGNPPFETFGVEIQCDRSRATKTRVRVARLNWDGRWPDGKGYGGVGMTIEQCDDAAVWASVFKGGVAAQSVGYQTTNIRYYGCQFGDKVSDGVPASITSGKHAAGAINFEQCDLVKLFDCSFYAHIADGQTGVHGSFSTLPGANGKLEFWNPTFNDDLNHGARLHWQSWNTGAYAGTNQARPSGYKADGTPWVGWDWRLGSPVVYSA